MTDIAKVFKALGDETRLKIVRCILHQELCACYFVQITKKDQTTVSRHLKVLTEAGVLSYGKRGKYRYYKIRDKDMRKMLLSFGIKPLETGACC